MVGALVDTFDFDGCRAWLGQYSRRWNIGCALANQNFVVPHLFVSVEHPREVGNFHLRNTALFLLGLDTSNAFAERVSSRAWMWNSPWLSFLFCLPSKIWVQFLRELTKLKAVIFRKQKSLVQPTRTLIWLRRSWSWSYWMNARWCLRAGHQHVVQSESAFLKGVRINKLLRVHKKS